MSIVREVMKILSKVKKGMLGLKNKITIYKEKTNKKINF